MKRNLFITALALAVALGNTSCKGNQATVSEGDEAAMSDRAGGTLYAKSGDYVDRDLKLPAFDGIEVNLGIKAIVKTDNGGQKVKAHIAKELARYFKATVKDGTLHLTFDTKRNINTGNREVAVVYVTVPSIDELKASVAGSVVCNGELKTRGELKVEASSAGSVSLSSVSCRNFTAEMSSAASLTVDRLRAGEVDLDANSAAAMKLRGVEARDVDLDASSSASVTLEGNAGKTAHFDVSSAASVKASGLKAASVTAEASSGASLSCYATEQISAKGSSGGSVKYAGRPTVVDINDAVKAAD